MSEEEEINRLIDEAADEYLPFDEILKKHNITFEEGLAAAENEKNRFFDTLRKYGINSKDISNVCLDVAEILKRDQNDDTIFLYISLLSEHILLFDNITDDEQKITLWLEYHKHFEYIQERIRSERILRNRFNKLIKHKPNFSLAACPQEEVSLLNELSKEHNFISKNINETYLENLSELIRKTNSDTLYSRIKPYIYSTVISRKYKYMMNHSNYSPNIYAVFKHNEYNIGKDNGKNFKKYKAYIELYCHMKDVFADESDIALSDHCFANLSNLSEWFYLNCEPSEVVPMTLNQVIQAYAEYLQFWQIELNGDDDTFIIDILTDAASFVIQ